MPVQVLPSRLRLMRDEGTMNIKTITVMAALTGVAAQAAEKAGAPAERHVTVCMQGDAGASLALASIHTRLLASNMFAAIGVTIDWRRGFGGCSSPSLKISLTDNTPA